jgi:hypothetical protein
MNEQVSWFSDNGEANFTNYIKNELAGRPIRVLQIGAYTGDASVWMLSNVLTNPNARLIDVDTWEGSEEPSHYEMNWQTVESLYDFKTQSGREDRKIIKYKGTSDSFFKNNVEKYDFIYIDGDHTAYGVLKDAVAAFECLKLGGIIAFDDYQWSAGLGAIKEPKMAIDAFSSIYADKIKEIEKGYQAWYRKLG